MQHGHDSSNRTIALVVLGAVTAFLYAWIARLSDDFHSPLNPHLRPLLNVLLLFGAATLAYLMACCVVWQTQTAAAPATTRRFSGVATIVGFGVLFRLIMLFSIPIQEIDLYRYILDGAVGNAGGDPYEFAPAEINQLLTTLRPPNDAAQQPPPPEVVFARDAAEREQLDRLTRYLADRPGLGECAARVHWGKYTTPYPPVSQAVFRLATAVVPEQASAYGWMIAMKATLIAFDVLTGFLLMGLLARASLPISHSLLYWWCPLIIKEIANSGHLDSIAICLTVGFAWLAVRGLWPQRRTDGRSEETPTSAWSHWSVLAGILLGLAVAAKIYPLVLAPAWTMALSRRGGWRAAVPVLAFVGVAAVALWPMVKRTESAQRLIDPTPQVTSAISLNTTDAGTADADAALITDLTLARRSRGLPELPVRRRPETGVEVFSKFWEMNDLIFMFIVENVRPNQPSDGTGPWFLVTSEAWRSDVSHAFADRSGISVQQAPFAIARRATLAIYCVLTLGFCVLAWRADSASAWIAVLFLSVAWFWMLSPTQNPWYWCWGIPFVAFLKRPLPWLVLGGMLFLYYLRFYFEQHYANTAVAGTSYHGFLFFDFVIPWIEFGPVYVWLVVAELVKSFERRGWRRKS